MKKIYYAGTMNGLGYKFMIAGTPAAYEVCAPIDATRFNSEAELLTYIESHDLFDLIFDICAFYVKRVV